MGEIERIRLEYTDREHRLAGSDLYSLFNPAQLFMIQQRQRQVLHLLRPKGFYPLDHQIILDVGCGEGGTLLEFLSYGATPAIMHGTDLLPKRIVIAHKRLPHVAMTNADGQALPYANASFDLVFQFTVFSSILDDSVKANLAREMLRVLTASGVILWYDFWLNPTNPQTGGIRPAEIRRIFPDCKYHFKRITLAPPLARRLVPLSWGLALFLEGLRIFNTHFLVAIQPLP